MKDLIRLNVARMTLVVVTLAIWEALTHFGFVKEYVLSRPSNIWDWFQGAVFDPFFWTSLFATIRETLLGLLLGGVLGILSGFALAHWFWVFRMLEPFIMALYSLPRVALAPLFLVWFGIGEASKVALAASLVYFVMLLSTLSGAREIDQNLVNAARTMGASNGFIARRILLPSSMAFIFSGLRVSIGLSLIGVIVGEMMAGQYGLGQMIARAANMFDTAQVFGIIIVLAVLAVALNESMKFLEQRAMRWRAPVRKV